MNKSNLVEEKGPMGEDPLSPVTTTPSGSGVCSPDSQSSLPPPGYLYGTVCRIDFWARMTSALGITQIVIGVCCVLFYLMMIYGRIIATIPLSSVGLMTGLVIFSAGIVGTVASKRKTRCMVCGFLVLSLLSAVSAMFPLVVGILQAAKQQNTNLLLPICELVFGTVEMVVATWSLGVCCQAMCCPNITFGHVSARYPSPASSLGVSHFLLSGDGHHVVMFAATPNHPPFAYTVPASHVPYVLQNGLTALPLVSYPRFSGAIVASGHSPEKATQTILSTTATTVSSATDATSADFNVEDEQAALLN